MGSNDLISLRGREKAARPFTRIEDLRRAAETEYLAEQQNLVARIEAAQAELDRLEQGAQLAEADQAASAYRLNWCKRAKLCAACRAICAAILRRWKAVSLGPISSSCR